MRKFLLAITLLVAVTCRALAVADHQQKAPSNDYLLISDEIAAEFANDEASDFFQQELDHRYLQTQTEVTTRCNFWCKLKQSLGLTIVGLILICLSPFLIWKNEGRHVRELRRIEFCKNKAVIVENSDLPTDDNTGQLVHFTGEVSVGNASLELTPGTALNITEPATKALIVKRTCYIYQKFEDEKDLVKRDRIGGGETTTKTFKLREDWTPMGPQPERLPHLTNETNSRGIWDDLVAAAGGDKNDNTASAAPSAPPNLPPQLAAMQQMFVDMSKAPNEISVSPAAHVGGFGLSKEIITEEPAVFQTEWSPLPSELVPNVVNGCEGLTKGSDGILRTVAEGEQPRNGDVMVKYEYIPDGFDCSFVVEQIRATESDAENGLKYNVSKADVIDDKCFGMIHDNLGVIWMVRKGRHDLPDMISMAKQDENTLTKVLRILCYVFLIGGWIMLFSIFTTLLSTLPILGTLGFAAVVIVALIVGTVCCCAVTAVAYIRYRPLVAFILLALGLGIWGIVIWRLGSAAQNSAMPTMAPNANSVRYLGDNY